MLFAILLAGAAATPNVFSQTLPPSIQVRGDLFTSSATFAAGKGTAAFMGGSITEMDGYRPIVMESLRKRFPNTEFEFVNAGISSTCSHTGAFRFRRDVLAKAPDLLLVEFAVNDDQDAGHTYTDAVRGMEGIIRAARLERPEMDIIMLLFVNESMLETIQRGETPVSIAAHLAVAERYGVSTCSVAVELAKQINAGEMTWAEYGGVHPQQPGNQLAANLVAQVFDHALIKGERKSDQRRSADEPPIDPFSFSNGRYLEHDQINGSAEWTWQTPDWKTIAGGFRDRFANRDLMVAEQPGAQCSFTFRGNAFGAYVLAGPDAGVLEYSVDGGEWKSRDLFHRFSKGLHYPRTVVLEAELNDGEHEVRLRVGESKKRCEHGTRDSRAGFHSLLISTASCSKLPSVENAVLQTMPS
ncbi:SGNH/GDSL hydrolase family protein [Rhodopirellula sp. MGV]|uniref:SGNH/GDSL hydrolase family protein n=1 Tax=Rhodopirellula sp. MGV TaxID=2023130 RepID=UPI001304638A|nr:SGNH/GDSL hydrolase family protein [Rhodopirellula sp. MGV]